MNHNVFYTYSNLGYLNDLVSGQLWFSPTREYNDIFEDTIFVQGEDKARKATIRKVHSWLDSRVVRCFTPIATNSLMWAHYADSHRGVCVGFHRNSIYRAPQKNIETRSISAVRYCSSSPMPFVSREPTKTEIDLMAMNVLLTKSNDWAYEQEFRAFTKNQALAEHGGGLIDIGSNAVAEIIFGFKVPVETIEEFSESLTTPLPCKQVRKDHRGITYDLDMLTHVFGKK